MQLLISATRSFSLFWDVAEVFVLGNCLVDLFKIGVVLLPLF